MAKTHSMLPEQDSWLEVTYQFVRVLLGLQEPTKRVPAPNLVGAPDANVLLMRGISWLDDDTFEKLEQRLTEAATPINPIRYSYKGADEISAPHYYTPHDIVSGDMVSFVEVINKYVRELLKWNVPVNIVAFSLGGLVLANWICRPDPPEDHYQIVAQVRTLVFLGSPLFPPYPWILIEHPVLGKQRWYHTPDIVIDGEVHGYDRRRLLSIISNTVVNVIGKADRLAPKKYASLAGYQFGDHLIEEEIAANHRHVSKHARSIELILQHVQRISTGVSVKIRG
jgi:hypothetical protein